MWIQLLSVQQFDLDGAAKRYQPGDWIDVGKQTALKLITTGQARSATSDGIKLDDDCGVVLLGETENSRAIIKRWQLGITVTTDAGAVIPFNRTAFWHSDIPLRPELLEAGFRFIEKWEMAVPVDSYEELAQDIGTASERNALKRVIHDLRVPVYNPGLLFVRRTPVAESIVLSVNSSGSKRLNLLSAIYVNKPLFLALPTTWIGKEVSVD